MFGFAIDALGWDEEARARELADHYENSVIKLIHRIVGTYTGRAVFREVERITVASGDVMSQKTMVIEPNINAPSQDIKSGDKGYTGDSTRDLAVNAYATAEDRARATPKGKIYGGERFGKGIDTPRRGIGGGGNTTVTFTPEHFVFKGLNYQVGIANPDWGLKGDEMLIHEMIHGLRHMAGLLHYRQKVPFQDGYNSIEEFFAILIANIYRSECDRQKIRKDHGVDFINMSEGEFIRKDMNRSHLRQLRRQHHPFFSELRKIDVPL
jgi:hypothetical protein